MGQMIQTTPFSNVVDHTKQVLSSQLERGTEKSAGQLGEVAEALRSTSKQLEGSGAAPYVEKAAQQIDKLANYVQNADLEEMKRGVEDFARREPLVFIGGAFALGMVAARFLKSSAQIATGVDQGGVR